MTSEEYRQINKDGTDGNYSDECCPVDGFGNIERKTL